MKPDITPDVVQAIIDLGTFALAFGQIDRVTYYPDGTTPESDTDHTVMLGLIACAFAERFAPALDRGRIAQFALVHDLVEVYAGDTVMGRIMSEEELRTKEEREHESLVRIRSEFDAQLPWLGETIDAYERRDTSEAKFVKTIDKVLPKITNILNGGVTMKERGHDVVSGREYIEHQRSSIANSYGVDQIEARALLEALGEKMMEEIFS